MDVIYIAIIVVLVLALGYVFYLYKKAAGRSQELERGLSLQKSYLHNMSHDVRTPMNALCGFSQILCNPQMKEMLTDEEIAEYGSIVQSNTDMLTSLVNDILEVGDMLSGQYRLNMGECKVNEVCRKAVSTVIYRCPDNVKMYMTSDLSDDYTIHSDGKRVAQIIINYLTNAVKHTTDGEIHLHASLDETPGMLTLSVTDTGDGVPADKVSELFNRFEQNDQSRGSSGIGLAICRNIATQLGGETKLDMNHKEKGARFILTHPVKA